MTTLWLQAPPWINLPLHLDVKQTFLGNFPIALTDANLGDVPIVLPDVNIHQPGLAHHDVLHHEVS